MESHSSRVLREFLVRAKKASFASSASYATNPELPHHKEISYHEDTNLFYIDSHIGEAQFAGMEEVRLGAPEPTVMWMMSYRGGMVPSVVGEKKLMSQTYEFLKEALLRVSEKFPFRGPVVTRTNPFTLKEFKPFRYLNTVQGPLESFVGHEEILKGDQKVYTLDYIGGLIL